MDNVTDEATQSIHNSVEKIKHSAEVRGKYMTIGEIMDYNKEIGYEEGKEDGRLEGICEAFRAINMPDEEILQKLMEMCGVSRDKALEYLKQK